jgi:hypothetical protein
MCQLVLELTGLCVQVAAGVGFILFLTQLEESELATFPVWDAPVVDELPTIGGGDEDEEAKGKGGAKRKPTGAAAASAKKAKK